MSYKHKIQYYETDKMGITHHSNYVRFMEEARVDFFEKIGWAYDRFEAEGIASPVTSIELEYKAPTTYPDEIEIFINIEAFRGIKLRLKYEMKLGDKTCCIAHSEHCFLKNGSLVKLDKEYPEFSEVLKSMIAD